MMNTWNHQLSTSTTTASTHSADEQQASLAALKQMDLLRQSEALSPIGSVTSPTATVYSTADLASDISSFNRRSSTSLAPSTIDTSLPGSTSTRHLSLSPIDPCFSHNAQCPPQYFGAQQDSHSPSFSSHSLSPYGQPAQFAELTNQQWAHAAPSAGSGGLDMNARSMTEPFPSASHFGSLIDDFSPGNLTLPKQHHGRAMVRNLSAQDVSSSAPRRQQNGYHPYSTSPQQLQQRRSTGNAIGLSHMQSAPQPFDGSIHGLDLYGFTVTSASDLPTLPPRYTATIPRPIDVNATYPVAMQPPRTVSPTLIPTGLVQPASATSTSFSSSSPTAHTVMIPRTVPHHPSYESTISVVEDPDATLVDTSFLSPSSYNKKDIIIPGLPQQDFSTESARWKAVQNRTHMADAHFVCAHLTTRVFCRPSCVAKKPERLRTTYFTFPGAIEAAESAGFRPCKRCKPEIPGTADNSALAVGQCIKQIVNETESVFNGGSVQLNDEGEMKNKTLKEYSKLAGLSPFHFHRCFKAVAAITPGEFVRAHTALTLQDRLGMDSHVQPLSAPQVEQTMLGWTIRRARKTLGGALPAMYARGCPDMDVQAIHADTTAGKVAFAYVEFGLDVGPPVMLACMLGDDAVQRVTKRFPGIKLREDATSWLKGVVDEVMKSAGREVQLPQSYVGHVRRARIAVSIRDELEAAVARHRAEQSFSAKSA